MQVRFGPTVLLYLGSYKGCGKGSEDIGLKCHAGRMYGQVKRFFFCSGRPLSVKKESEPQEPVNKEDQNDAETGFPRRLADRKRKRKRYKTRGVPCLALMHGEVGHKCSCCG